MIRHFILFLFIMGCSSFLYAETAIGVEDAVKNAINQNLSLKGDQISLNAKKRASDLSWNAIVPSLSVSSTLMKYNQAASGSTNNWSMTNLGKVTLSLSSSFLLDMTKTIQQYDAQKITYAQAKMSLEKSVRESFYSILLEQENIKLQEQKIARAQSVLDQNQANYKAGLTSEIDLMTAKVDLETLKPTLESLKTTLINDLGQFKYLLGIPLTESITLQGNLDMTVKENFEVDLKTSLIQDSYDLASAKASAKTAELTLQSEQASNLLPSFTLSWLKEPYNSDISKSSSTWTDSGYMTLGLSWSLDGFLPFSSTAETLRGYEDSLKTAQLSVTEAQITQELNRSNYLRKVQQAQQALTALKMNEDLAQKTYDLAREAYRRGTKELTSLQSAEGDLQTAQYNVLSQKYTLIADMLDLEQELGVSFGTLTGDNK